MTSLDARRRNGDPLDSAFRQRARDCLSPLGLTPTQKREAWREFHSCPDGVERIALAALAGDRPAALFLDKLRRGEHELEPHRPTRFTGWRFVRGSHSGTYVRDPRGTDRLPEGYVAEPLP